MKREAIPAGAGLYAIELSTARLELRPWRLTDIDDAFAYGSDPQWAQYLWEVPQPYLRSHAEKFVVGASDNHPGNSANFAITLADRVVGGVRLYVLDEESRVGGMGYHVAPAHWGQGIATEAASAVLQAAFQTSAFGRSSAMPMPSIRGLSG